MAPRRRTVVLGTATVLLLLLVAAVGGVVGLTQTDRGRAFILRTVLPIARAAIPGTLHVSGLHGTLFTELAIDSLDLRTADGKPFLTTGPIRLTYDPRDLLDARIVIKSLEVTRPRITLIDYGNDDWNWKRALRRGPSKPKGATSSLTPPRCTKPRLLPVCRGSCRIPCAAPSVTARCATTSRGSTVNAALKTGAMCRCIGLCEVTWRSGAAASPIRTAPARPSPCASWT
jgi:hypothetical protein